MGRFLKRLFEKELAWIRSLLRFPSKRQNTTPAASSRAGKPTPQPTQPTTAISPSHPKSKVVEKTPRKSGRKPSAAAISSPKKNLSRPRKLAPKSTVISSDRKSPLPREIAPPPSDTFSSVVASTILHGSLLLILVPFLFPDADPPPPLKTVVIRWEAKKQEVPVEAKPDPEPLQNKESEPVEITEPETVKEPQTNSDAGEELVNDVAGLGASEGTQGNSRQGTARSSAIRIHGGNPDTEGAVKAGLLWLIRHQDSDGSWSPDQFDRHCLESDATCNGAGYPEHRAGITAIVLLALLGDGHLPQESDDPFAVSCQRALQWLLDHTDKDGCIRSNTETGSRNLYDHGIATFALCEAAQLTQNPSLIESARRAIRFLESSQQPGGGWDYTPAPSLRNDLSITGWQVLALHAGIEAGILPNPKTIASLERYLRRAIDETGHAVYADRGRGRGRKGFGIDAVGLISRLSLGHSPVSSESLACADRLAAHPPQPETRAQWDQYPQSMYYWYTATLALFHVGGTPWKKWNQQLQQQILPLQIQQGESSGSWDPDPNWIGAAGGRVAQTALGVLTFETYFRYTPLYQRLGIARNQRNR
ncbi:MAG: prenyltransferase/squalene oxidase repeat-containing protein [Planctomycetota bacterium]